jgi:hypothetical protein
MKFLGWSVIPWVRTATRPTILCAARISYPEQEIECILASELTEEWRSHSKIVKQVRKLIIIQNRDHVYGKIEANETRDLLFDKRSRTFFYVPKICGGWI